MYFFGFWESQIGDFELSFWFESLKSDFSIDIGSLATELAASFDFGLFGFSIPALDQFKISFEGLLSECQNKFLGFADGFSEPDAKVIQVALAFFPCDAIQFSYLDGVRYFADYFSNVGFLQCFSLADETFKNAFGDVDTSISYYPDDSEFSYVQRIFLKDRAYLKIILKYIII